MKPGILLLLSAAVALGGAATCVPVPGDQILGGDMARAVPVFAAVPPELVLGYVPAPGARRTYAAAELARLARRHGLAVEPGQEACFIRPLETLTRERVAASLQAAMPAAHLEVLDFSRQPVPPGELRLEPSTAGAGSEQVWHGAVRRPGQADFPVWAKVRIRVTGTRAVAAETLPAGLRIARAQFRAETYEGPPGLPEPSQVVGRVPRRTIPAGTAIESQWLEDPADVESGERVQVEVRSGPARLLLEGQAQSSGRRGQVIAVRNPANGKVFRATVQERGRVTLATGPPGPTAAPGEVP